VAGFAGARAAKPQVSVDADDVQQMAPELVHLRNLYLPIKVLEGPRHNSTASLDTASTTSNVVSAAALRVAHPAMRAYSAAYSVTSAVTASSSGVSPNTSLNAPLEKEKSLKSSSSSPSPASNRLSADAFAVAVAQLPPSAPPQRRPDVRQFGGTAGSSGTRQTTSKPQTLGAA